MKIYFDITQFPKTLEECSVNNNQMVLNHDIEYIPSNFNKVVIENNEADKEDWKTVCANWDDFISYLIETIEENMQEDDEEVCEGMTCIDIFENEFVISGSK